MERYLLGIDLGSGSVKATLLSAEGVVRGVGSREYPTEFPRVGFAEQDPEAWCEALRGALAALFQDAGVAPEEVAAIAPDAATHTAVLLDEEKRPLDRAILWTDQRSVEEVRFLREAYGALILKQALHAPTTVWTLPQCLWIREHKPEVWAKVRHILFAKDYLRYRLTGRMMTDTIEAMGSMFYDAQSECWSRELCAVGGIDEAWLPTPVAPTDPAGEVTREAAAYFGLREGTRVLVGSTDTVLEQLAAGSVAVGHGVVKLATAGRICVISDAARPSPFLFNYRHVVPGLWYPGTGTKNCAASYRWYRDALGGAAYDALNAGAAQIPPGCEGLMYHPYLQGELTPYNDPLLRGSFTGLSARHTRAHFTRAVLEGVAYSLRDCLDTLRENRLEMTRARIIGGGAKSPLWRGIVSDMLGLRLEKAEVDDSSFGAAMLAGVGIGAFSSFEDAAARCVRVQSVTEPNPENHRLYEREFARYRRLHDALAPIYHDMIPEYE